MTVRRIFFLVAVAAVSILLLALAAGSVWIGCNIVSNAKQFDSTAWRNGSERVRGRMAKSLVREGYFVGKTREEVTEALGSPNVDTVERIGFTVDLGHRFGSGVWNYTVWFDFDKLGKVSAIAIAD